MVEKVIVFIYNENTLGLRLTKNKMFCKIDCEQT